MLAEADREIDEILRMEAADRGLPDGVRFDRKQQAFIVPAE